MDPQALQSSGAKRIRAGKPGAGLPTGFAVPVLETGSPGPAGFATGFAVPVLETGKGGGKAGAPAAVDLEQREGRINRRDSLSIRDNIASNHPLMDLAKSPWNGRNIWLCAFERAEHCQRNLGRYKHGLYPHWIEGLSLAGVKDRFEGPAELCVLGFSDSLGPSRLFVRILADAERGKALNESV